MYNLYRPKEYEQKKDIPIVKIRRRIYEYTSYLYHYHYYYIYFPYLAMFLIIIFYNLLSDTAQKMSPFWSWFCGERRILEVNETTIIQRWHPNISVTADDECVVNFLSTCPHILFLLVSTIFLLSLSCTTYKDIKCVYLRKFSCHTFRWVLLLIFALICVCAIAEGVLTDLTYRTNFTTQPHLYLPACFALLAVIFSLVYYHHCEVWQAPRLSWMPLLYWFLAFSGEILKLISFHANIPEDGNKLIYIFRYDIIIISALVYFTMMVLEFVVLCSKVS